MEYPSIMYKCISRS